MVPFFNIKKLNIDITKQVNLINLHVVMENGDSKIIGEIVYSNRNSMYINIVGEIQGEEFIQGASRKPSFNALVRLIKLDEISKILGPQDTRFGTILFGTSNIYIKNLGSKTNPSKNVSVQRTNTLTIDNSYIELSGTTDRTNEYSTYKYSFNRIDELECIQSLYNIIPICPEILGGLSTPRPPAERVGQLVINNIGVDVTKEFVRGALRTLTIAQDNNCHRALLKAKSPSCGCGEIYDGTFSGILTTGNGVTTDLLLENHIEVFTEKNIDSLIPKKSDD